MDILIGIVIGVVITIVICVWVFAGLLKVMGFGSGKTMWRSR